jgi:clan AA aspartic protease
MITGNVDSHHKPVVTVQVSGPTASIELTIVLDTGFSGFLALPDTLIQELGLAFSGTTVGLLANGTRTVMAVYEGTIFWDGRVRDIEVLETDGPSLIGMGLLYGHLLAVECVDGGKVLITPLPVGS